MLRLTETNEDLQVKRKKINKVFLICIIITMWIVAVITADRLIKTDYCREKEVVAFLRNDRKTPEFVLDGTYFVLPCSLSDFTDNGWYVFDVGYSTDSGLVSADWEETVIPANSYTVVILRNDHFGTDSVRVCVCNPSEIPHRISDCQVHRAEYSCILDKTKSNRNFFVTAYAVNLTTSWSKVIDKRTGYRYMDFDQGYGQYAFIEFEGVHIIEVLPRKNYNDISSNAFRIQTPLMIDLKYISFQ